MMLIEWVFKSLQWKKNINFVKIHSECTIWPHSICITSHAIRFHLSKIQSVNYAASAFCFLAQNVHWRLFGFINLVNVIKSDALEMSSCLDGPCHLEVNWHLIQMFLVLEADSAKRCDKTNVI